jgi:DNA-binding transcriptional LysR family regulator
MNSLMSNAFDWTHLQSFLAVADGGSLSAAARSLGSSQPTVGRHVCALEETLGIQLFDRTPAGLSLTPSGADLTEHARAMSEAANRFSLTAAGRTQTIAGTIRITASEIVSAYVLPPILTALRCEENEIEIELVASDRTENLIQREADIAVRMYRPNQADVITRKVGEFDLGIYASKQYLERRGSPQTGADLQSHDVIGYDKDDQIIHGFREAGFKVDRRFFPFRCDNQLVCWKMVIAGYGIGFNQIRVGDADPRVVRVCPDVEIPALPLWLTAHTELKTSRRVRRVFDFLADALTAYTRNTQEAER